MPKIDINATHNSAIRVVEDNGKGCIGRQDKKGAGGKDPDL